MDNDKDLGQLEDLAFQGAEMPKGLRFPEQLLFLRFRCLYAYARLIQMDPVQGKREKEQIVTEYIGCLASYQTYERCVEMWKAVETAASEIRKDPVLYANEKVRALMLAIYGKEERVVDT